MPVAKIHVLEGRYDEARLGRVSNAVQQGLISALGIPPDDFFQIIHVLPATQFRHTRSFLELNYLDDLILLKLPGCRGRDGGLLEAEIGEPRPLLWSSRENDLSPTCCHDATFSLSEMWARWARPRPNEMFSPGVS